MEELADYIPTQCVSESRKQMARLVPMLREKSLGKDIQNGSYPNNGVNSHINLHASWGHLALQEHVPLHLEPVPLLKGT
jgi:hypothetical protein